MHGCGFTATPNAPLGRHSRRSSISSHIPMAKITGQAAICFPRCRYGPEKKGGKNQAQNPQVRLELSGLVQKAGMSCIQLRTNVDGDALRRRAFTRHLFGTEPVWPPRTQKRYPDRNEAIPHSGYHKPRGIDQRELSRSKGRKRQGRAAFRPDILPCASNF